MKTRSFALAVFCFTLAACNSKSADEGAATDGATEAVAPAPAPKMDLPVMGEPAPEGLPSRIAREVIGTSGQKCDGVTKADRNDQDGSITASCGSGETYRIYTVPGKGPVATAM